MAFNDFIKKAMDTVSSAADSAKTMYAEKKQAMDEQKAEKERVKAEMQAQTETMTNELLEALSAGKGNAIKIDTNKLLEFTAEYYDKLYLPAHSISSSVLTFHPNAPKIIKVVQKQFAGHLGAGEKPVFMLSMQDTQNVFLSDKSLYFRKVNPNNSDYFIIGHLPIDNIASMSYSKTENGYVFSCNGVELISSSHGFDLDIQAFNDYFERIVKQDFAITDDQIDALIQEKIGANILKIVREYIFDDEKLLYFAWGADSITAADFIVCSDKQMVMLDRESFGLTKNVKQFYYDDVTSMATLQQTNGLLDLALTVALSVCDLEISVAGAKERISTLKTYEAEKVVKVYRECRKAIKTANSQPQVIVQQQTAPQNDPLAQLEKLADLKAKGILSEEEFNAKKAELLSKM
ncbi:MAG: SHOCT domain-containing protein [Oscillospiraceae bacterium]